MDISRILRVVLVVALVGAFGSVCAGCNDTSTSEKAAPSDGAGITGSSTAPVAASGPGTTTGTAKAALTEGVTIPTTFSSPAALTMAYVKQPSVGADREPTNTDVGVLQTFISNNNSPSKGGAKDPGNPSNPTPGSTVIPTVVPQSCLTDPLNLEEKPGPYSHLVKATDFAGNVFYVDSQVSSGDGSKAAPFGTIGEALKAASLTNKTAAVLVAGGIYNEDLDVQEGQYLFGGFDSTTWIRNLRTSLSVIRNQKGSLTISQSTNFPTIIDGFTVYGAVEAVNVSDAVHLESGARLILRNNTIYMSMSTVTWETYGDKYHGTAVVGVDASADIYHNRFLIDYAAPEHTISAGLSFNGGCVVIANNHFSGYRASIFTYESRAAIEGNVTEDGFNGYSVFGGNVVIDHNTIGLLAHAAGCGYAIILGHYGDFLDSEPATHPSITQNTIILEGQGAQGITEPYNNGDPTSLVDNRFILQDAAMKAAGNYMLYGDFDTSHTPGKIVRAIKTIAEVNGLTDIAEVSGNTVE